jgi:xanthine/uracil permease
VSLLSWKLHGNGKTVNAGEVVLTDERLTWPRTIGVGLQHIAAMFGATFLVPIITGFPPTTTLFFSGIGTLIFLAMTKNKVPSYLGSSFAFLAPIAAAKTNGGMGAALGGVVVTGVILAVVGLIVKQAGIGWINWMLPPVVTGTIVMVIGLNLAGAAKNNFVAAPMIGVITLASIGVISAFSRGFMGRISVFLGLFIGYENIGVMAATRVYSTAAYWIAGVGAIGLSLSPKFGAVLSATPVGALGGVGVALFGMIGVVGARIWIEGKVDFANSTNLLIAGSALIIGIADMSWTRGDYTFNGIINATLVAILGYRILHSIADARGNK